MFFGLRVCLVILVRGADILVFYDSDETITTLLIRKLLVSLPFLHIGTQKKNSGTAHSIGSPPSQLTHNIRKKNGPFNENAQARVGLTSYATARLVSYQPYCILSTTFTLILCFTNHPLCVFQPPSSSAGTKSNRFTSEGTSFVISRSEMFLPMQDLEPAPNCFDKISNGASLRQGPEDIPRADCAPSSSAVPDQRASVRV